MKVNNNKDSVDLSQASRAKRGDKAGAAKAKAADDSGSAASAGAIGAAAGVEISSEAKTIAAANQAARAGGDTDEAKIARVKAMINGGTYKPDFGKVADKMVNETMLQDLSN